MEFSNHINLADPAVRRALFETGKWSRLIAIVSGIILLLIALGALGVFIFVPGALDEAFFDNPMLPQSPAYLIVLYTASVLVGIVVSFLLYRFGSTLKGGGPTHPLANTEINSAFGQLALMLKCYAVFSGVSLVGSLVGLIF